MAKAPLLAHPFPRPLSAEQEQAYWHLFARLCSNKPLSLNAFQSLMNRYSAALPMPLQPQMIPLMPWIADRLCALKIDPALIIEEFNQVEQTFHGLYKRAFQQKRVLSNLLLHLAEKQIRVLVFKGAVISTNYPNPLLRPASDLDVAVPISALNKVEAELTILGWKRIRRKKTTQLWIGPFGVHLDLHVLSTPWGRRIWRESVPFCPQDSAKFFHRKPTTEGHLVLFAFHSSGQYYKKLWRDLLDIDHLSINISTLNVDKLIAKYSFGDQQLQESLVGFVEFLRRRESWLVQNQSAFLHNSRTQLSLADHYINILKCPIPSSFFEELSLLGRFPRGFGSAMLAIRSILESYNFSKKPTNTDFWLNSKCRKLKCYRLKLKWHLMNQGHYTLLKYIYDCSYRFYVRKKLI
ncbi:MAG: nucleotidyltransferase family protein [Sumerlaeia bacterium]